MKGSSAQISVANEGDAPELAVVIVNYKSWPDAARLVETLAPTDEMASGRCELIVVDNDSGEAVPGPLAPPPAGVRILLRPENGGFAAGVNAGWRASRAPWILLLNPDVVADAGLLGRVLERLADYDSRPQGAPGVVGFGLLNADGSRQPSVGADPSLWRSVREPFIPRPRRKYQAGWRTNAGPVPWVTGACALVSARLLRALNGMDEEFFLYYEEVALCRSARRLGRAVEYDPGVEVVHLRPLQNRPVSPKMRVITRHSKLLYFRKHLPRWQFLGMSRLVAWESRTRGAWSSLRGRTEESRAWRTVGWLASAMRRGERIGGREVLRLAEAAVASGTPSDPKLLKRRATSTRREVTTERP